MTLAIRKITGGGNQTLLDTDDGKFLDVDAGGGNTVLQLPAADTLPAGWHVPAIMKTDAGSGLVGFKTTQAGDKLNWFWDTTAPYPLWMNVSQQAAELVCDGVSRYHLMGKPFHRNVPQSQRTFVSTPSLQSFNVRPQDTNELIEVDASQAAMGIYFDPVGHFTRGGYLSSIVEFVRMDASANTVTIFAHGGQQIGGASSVSLNGYQTRLRCYIDAARIVIL